MSDKEKMIAVFKAVIDSAKMTDGGYLKGSLTYKENDDDNLKLVITYYGETQCKAPEMFVKVPWMPFAFSRFIRANSFDDDLDDICLAVGSACNSTTERLYRWYFHRNLDAICKMLNINTGKEA